MAQGPSGASNTKISAFPLLSEEAAVNGDREGGDGSTLTLQKSEGQARSVAVFPHLLLANRPEEASASCCTGERGAARAAPQLRINQRKKLGDGVGRK